MNTTKASTAVAIELGKEATEYTTYLLQDGQDNDKARKKKRKHEKRDRCKRFITQTMTMLSRFASLFDLITDFILLWKASSRNVIELTLILSLSIVSPYILSYSSGIKLFIYRKTFDNLVGFRNIFLILYLLPTGFFYFVLLDLIDILLSIWIWFLHNILCRQEQYLKELQEIIAKDLGMDRMNFEGFKRQKSISQILFESIPQVTLQILLELNVIPGKQLAGIKSIELRISIATAMFNLITQISKLYFESVAVNERFVEYQLNAMMGRVSWVPFRLKVVKLARNLQDENEFKTNKRKHGHTSLCRKLFSVRYNDPNDDENTINYNIKYRIPLISYFSRNDILANVDYDFSVVTIGHLIATINQLQNTTASHHGAHISIKFHKSLKLLGIKEIVKLMEVCKRKNILLPDIAQCVDWTHSFSISSTIHQNDPRLATYCRDYNDRPLLISMYKTKYDAQYSIFNSFLENDCPMNLKDSNNETIVYHMIRNRDYKGLRILFEKQKEKNFEMNTLNFYNKAGISPLYLALKYDLLSSDDSEEAKEEERVNKPGIQSDADQKGNDAEEDVSDLSNTFSSRHAVKDNGQEEEPHFDPKEEQKHEDNDADEEEWQERVIKICIAQRYEYNTVCNMIRYKLNCALMERLSCIQRNRELLHCVYECIYQCKKGNAKQFQSRCINPKIAELAKAFETSNDIKALLSTIQELLNSDHADIADCGPQGVEAEPFSELIDRYDRNRMQNIIKIMEKRGFEAIDSTVNEYMNDYPIINEIERKDNNESGRSKIHAGSQWMYRMILDNGADVNSPCFDSDNANRMTVSPLGFCLTNYFDSLHHIDIIQDLLDRNAKITQGETAFLCELFVQISAKEEDKMDMYFGILEHIAKNSRISLHKVSDLDGNNPIHTAIIHHHAFNQNKEEKDSMDDARQTRILSQLCKRYPFWTQQRNVDGNYPLFLSARHRDVTSMFALIAFLSEHNHDAMKRMMEEKAFIEFMVSWVMSVLPKSSDDPSPDIKIAKLLFELFGYEAICIWPNPPDSNSPQSPITLMDAIASKGGAQRTVMIDSLIEKCNLLQYVDKHLIQNAQQAQGDNEEDALDYGDEEKEGYDVLDDKKQNNDDDAEDQKEESVDLLDPEPKDEEKK
eukprot:573498_1